MLKVLTVTYDELLNRFFLHLSHAQKKKNDFVLAVFM